ncbi:MAG: hypothetical protein ACRDDA_06655, partial [Aeromonas sp.]
MADAAGVGKGSGGSDDSSGKSKRETTNNVSFIVGHVNRAAFSPHLGKLYIIIESTNPRSPAAPPGG